MLSLDRRELLALASATAGTIWGTGVTQGNSEAKLPEECHADRGQFTFFHSYEATGQYWRGLEAVGLMDHTYGIRLVNPPWGGDDRRFNQVARRGGELQKMIDQRRCPFLIDRLVGGSPYRPYEYDLKLIEYYDDLLRERFFGAQIHEPVCNTRNDWRRIVEANSRFGQDPVDRRALQEYFNSDHEKRWLEFGGLTDYDSLRAPQTDAEIWSHVERAVQREANRVAQRFFVCEGSNFDDVGWHVWYRLGARVVVAETGVDSASLNQFAVAALRGAARAAQRPWGILFAPWGPRGCTSFVDPPLWSWQCPVEPMERSGWLIGPNLGPSSALQRRVMFHALMSGAHMIHEEWGAEGNLKDWSRPELSSYGRATKEFLDFAKSYPDVGDPYTPIALIVNAHNRPPELGEWNRLKWTLHERAKVDDRFRAGDNLGQAEARCIADWALPEVFDIVPSDAPQAVWSKYRQRFVMEDGLGAMDADRVAWRDLLDALKESVDKHAPFTHDTAMPMQINLRRSDQAWLIAIYNPWGAKRGDVDGLGSLLHDPCQQTDVITSRQSIAEARVLYSWPNSASMTCHANRLQITVGPGGLAILQVKWT